MAAETSPTLTSTSHTLEALPATMPATNPTSYFLQNLAPSNRHVFLQPPPSLPTTSLNIVKDTLEDFAGTVVDEQQIRLKKRKRGEDKGEVLKVRKVYVDGFETNQVWQQARKVIEGVLRYADGRLGELQDEGVIVEDLDDDEEGSPAEAEEDDDEEEDEMEEDVSDGGLEAELNGNGLLDEEASEDGEELEFEDAQEDFEDDDYEDVEEDDEEDADGPEEEYEADPDGLNDGFFSLDEFNKQSQYFEDQDAKGDPNTDQASDDEDIDWNADPMSAEAEALAAKTKKAQDGGDMPEDDDDDDSEGGPTFGDMDLDAPEGASDDEDMVGNLDDGVADGLGEFNANEVYYKDFFAPPKRKRDDKRPKNKKSVRFDSKAQHNAEDVERAMEDVKRDLFEDESEMEDSADGLSDVDAGDPKSRRSAHERRQARLAEEIRKLEAASVAKREWTLSGEAAAADRPVNSLLEQDLDFEHGGKPVPVITPEISESIEDLIKRRILAQEFDEVIRRRPGTESMPASTRRGLLAEVDDTKGKSLAEVYEEEHAKTQDPEAYVSQSDEKLQREEKEIENMWKDVSSRLDALSSWHYRPRPVEPSLSVVADVATVSMEDAQPTTASAIGGESSRMAPQEVYTANRKTAAAGEVVHKGGAPLAKQEMSREDKQRQRRREKERVRKAGGVGGGKALSKRAQLQKDTMADLKKGGVKVINRKGEVTDVDGKKVKGVKTASSGSYKL
ncbi:U3 small nucleolar ribonucleoprotein-like protein [Emericellopsis cladophorae]|uniref:U3 small nucleolar ribonucleoprotein protein MPP10 n=1 Tax=Emericellopsis cladophorae TaxID=2686198 RepID=A0A9P9XZF1_9HYPO|nr:U3 small nucleolar ribonucleoprotein-like protein [Emericellopsis cladophorae]KAI6780729.1 U3 small nucleolar ribonucleoprotein-like protein [Emericellopsis cladophorae]